MTERNMKCLDVLAPRGLIQIASGMSLKTVTEEGLCPLRISVDGNRIAHLESLRQDASSPSRILLPRLVEPHSHLDKAFTWTESPNLSGGYQGALEANLREHQHRTFERVYSRAERALKLAIRNGLRAVRTHVDSFGVTAEQSWEALFLLKKRWQPLIDVELVALVPLEYWSSKEGKAFGARVAKASGLLGGVLVPPFDKAVTRRYLMQMLKLANELGCGIDLHIDETHLHPADGLKLLIDVLDCYQAHVPITCSHLSSMGLLSDRNLRRLADRLAHYRVNVVVLPLTNFWLLGRKNRISPIKRPFAPILQLQHAGVTVAVGGDNVQDPWFPAGNFDPLSLMSLSMPLAQIAPWERLGLSPFTTAASALLNLEWDGCIREGCPANLLFLEAKTWSEALSTPPSRQIMINGEWLEKKNFSMQNSIAPFD